MKNKILWSIISENEFDTKCLDERHSFVFTSSCCEFHLFFNKSSQKLIIALSVKLGVATYKLPAQSTKVGKRKDSRFRTLENHNHQLSVVR